MRAARRSLRPAAAPWPSSERRAAVPCQETEIPVVETSKVLATAEDRVVELPRSSDAIRRTTTQSAQRSAVATCGICSSWSSSACTRTAPSRSSRSPGRSRRTASRRASTSPRSREHSTLWTRFSARTRWRWSGWRCCGPGCCWHGAMDRSAAARPACSMTTRTADMAFSLNLPGHPGLDEPRGRCNSYGRQASTSSVTGCPVAAPSRRRHGYQRSTRQCRGHHVRGD